MVLPSSGSMLALALQLLLAGAKSLLRGEAIWFCGFCHHCHYWRYLEVSVLLLAGAEGQVSTRLNGPHSPLWVGVTLAWVMCRFR